MVEVAVEVVMLSRRKEGSKEKREVKCFACTIITITPASTLEWGIQGLEDHRADLSPVYDGILHKGYEVDPCEMQMDTLTLTDIRKWYGIVDWYPCKS